MQALKNTSGDASVGRARKASSIISTLFSCTGIVLISWAIYQGFISSFRVFDSSLVGLGLALIIFSAAARNTGNTIGDATLGRAKKAGSIISTFFSCTGIFLISWTVYQGFIKALYQGFISSFRVFDSSLVGLGLALIIFSAAARNTGNTIGDATLGRAKKAGSIISTFFSCTGIFLISWTVYQGFIKALYQGFISSFRVFDSSLVGLGLALIIFSAAARNT
ncbi:MAG: hypothetical protein N2V75_05060, partial [Methanophagales archaeon]|nr:hypothetical protein [Methanophagales archaeon]